ncbi:glutamic acid-rich protein-like [Argiope bruennichi]|uniref:glutamic acid-rich protein-like n=1 Tax=Argiope bruennichi TaxID=94029 RepID=UPI002493EEBB|nr:glutamic acid-rich protein-like [Argiope bruennichi]
MTRTREMLLDPEEEKLLLPSSSEDEEEDNSDAYDKDEPEIKDPFENEDSDSDSPPIAVTNKVAVENERKFRQYTSQVIKTHIDERKRKRKEMHEQYLKEKEEKRQKIDDKKLPDDILENLKDKADEDYKESSDNEKGLEETSGDESNNAAMNSEDVIAVHGPTVFKCKVLPEESKKPKHIREEVVNFKNNLLFGGRIRREKSSRDAMLKHEKQMARHRLKAVR